MDPIALDKNYSALRKFVKDDDNFKDEFSNRKYRKRKARAVWPYDKEAVQLPSILNSPVFGRAAANVPASSGTGLPTSQVNMAPAQTTTSDYRTRTKRAHCHNTLMGCIARGMSFEQMADAVLKEAASDPELDDAWHEFFESAPQSQSAPAPSQSGADYSALRKAGAEVVGYNKGWGYRPDETPSFWREMWQGFQPMYFGAYAKQRSQGLPLPGGFRLRDPVTMIGSKLHPESETYMKAQSRYAPKGPGRLYSPSSYMLPSDKALHAYGGGMTSATTWPIATYAGAKGGKAALPHLAKIPGAQTVGPLAALIGTSKVADNVMRGIAEAGSAEELAKNTANLNQLTADVPNALQRYANRQEISLEDLNRQIAAYAMVAAGGRKSGPEFDFAEAKMRAEIANSMRNQAPTPSPQPASPTGQPQLAQGQQQPPTGQPTQPTPGQPNQSGQVEMAMQPPVDPWGKPLDPESALYAKAQKYAKAMPSPDQIWKPKQFARAEMLIKQRGVNGWKPVEKELREYIMQRIAAEAANDPAKYGRKMAKVFAGGPPDRETLANILKDFGTVTQGGLSSQDVEQMLQDPGIMKRITGWFTDPQTPVHHKLGVALGIPLALVGGAMALMGKNELAGMLMAGTGAVGMMLPTGILDPIINWGLGKAHDIGLLATQDYKPLGGAYGDTTPMDAAQPETPAEAAAATNTISLKEPGATASGVTTATPGAETGTASGGIQGPPTGAAAPGGLEEAPPSFSEIMEGDDKDLIAFFKGMKEEQKNKLLRGLWWYSDKKLAQVMTGILRKEKRLGPNEKVTPEQVARMRRLKSRL